MTEITSKVAVTTRVQETLSEYLKKTTCSQLGVLVDTNTKEFCYPLIEQSLPAHHILEIPAGEAFKKLDTCNTIWGQMTHHQMDRQSLLINLGGGVIGDMGGFCAATFKRGLSFINLPTTLLAQVDASIGGKLGIDFQGFKNHIGLFQDPDKIIISTEFLQTLPYQELRSGFAEVLKHALITDHKHWRHIHKFTWEEQPWQEHIAHSVYTKQQVVEEDPQEIGLRKILNYGHTIGHAIERFYLSQPTPLLHGEAIAIGMIAEAYLSNKITGLPSTDLKEITDKLLHWFGKVHIEETTWQAIAQNTLQDKKNSNGQIKCTLLQQLGTATFDVTITSADIMEAMGYYHEQ